MNEAIRARNEFHACLDIIADYPFDYWLNRLTAAYNALEIKAECDTQAYFVALSRFANINPLHVAYAPNICEPGETPMETRSSLGV